MSTTKRFYQHLLLLRYTNNDISHAHARQLCAMVEYEDKISSLNQIAQYAANNDKSARKFKKKLISLALTPTKDDLFLSVNLYEKLSASDRLRAPSSGDVLDDWKVIHQKVCDLLPQENRSNYNFSAMAKLVQTFKDEPGETTVQKVNKLKCFVEVMNGSGKKFTRNFIHHSETARSRLLAFMSVEPNHLQQPAEEHRYSNDVTKTVKLMFSDSRSTKAIVQYVRKRKKHEPIPLSEVAAKAIFKHQTSPWNTLRRYFSEKKEKRLDDLLDTHEIARLKELYTPSAQDKAGAQDKASAQNDQALPDLDKLNKWERQAVQQAERAANPSGRQPVSGGGAVSSSSASNVTVEAVVAQAPRQASNSQQQEQGLQSFDDKIAAKKAELSRLESQIKLFHKSERTAGHESNIAQSRLAQINTELDKASQALLSKQNELLTVQQRLDEARRHLQQQAPDDQPATTSSNVSDANHASLQQTVAELTQQKENLRAQISAQQAKLQALQSLIKEMEETMQLLDKYLADKQTEIEKVKTNLNQQNTLLEDNQKRLEQQMQQKEINGTILFQQQQALKEREKLLAAKKDTLKAYEAKHGDLDEFFGVVQQEYTNANVLFQAIKAGTYAPHSAFNDSPVPPVGKPITHSQVFWGQKTPVKSKGSISPGRMFLRKKGYNVSEGSPLSFGFSPGQSPTSSDYGQTSLVARVVGGESTATSNAGGTSLNARFTGGTDSNVTGYGDTSLEPRYADNRSTATSYAGDTSLNPRPQIGTESSSTGYGVGSLVAQVKEGESPTISYAGGDSLTARPQIGTESSATGYGSGSLVAQVEEGESPTISYAGGDSLNVSGWGVRSLSARFDQEAPTTTSSPGGNSLNAQVSGGGGQFVLTPATSPLGHGPAPTPPPRSAIPSAPSSPAFDTSLGPAASGGSFGASSGPNAGSLVAGVNSNAAPTPPPKTFPGAIQPSGPQGVSPLAVHSTTAGSIGGSTTSSLANSLSVDDDTATVTMTPPPAVRSYVSPSTGDFGGSFGGANSFSETAEETGSPVYAENSEQTEPVQDLKSVFAEAAAK